MPPVDLRQRVAAPTANVGRSDGAAAAIQAGAYRPSTEPTQSARETFQTGTQAAEVMLQGTMQRGKSLHLCSLRECRICRLRNRHRATAD